MRAQDFVGAREANAVEILFVAVAALLLIACANVASLLLMRGWSRRREFAVRVALGAGRTRLMRQLVMESVGLALAGGALALFVARAGLALIVALRPPSMTELAVVRVDTSVLIWSGGVSLLAGLALGLVSALLAAGRSVADDLRTDARTVSDGAGSRRVRSGLVIAEIALSLLLLVSAGLLVRSFVALQRTPLGYDAAGLVHVAIIGSHGQTVEQVNDAQAEIARRLVGLGGVTGAVTGSFPGTGFVTGGAFQVDEPGGPRATDVHIAAGSFVSPGYFRLARIAVLAGRTFTPNDVVTSEDVVVNRALAERLWPGSGAVGKRFRFSEHAPWSTVIGVVGDIRNPGSNGDQYDLQVYQLGGGNRMAGGILLRDIRPADAEAELRRTIAEVMPTLKVLRIVDGESVVHRALAPQRFATVLLGSFAVVALVLAAVGLYGTVSYAVTHRTREIGVRVALGAGPGSVVRLVLTEGLWLTAGGVAIGLAGAAVATRSMRSMLYGVGPFDPWTFSTIALLLGATTFVATYVPVRRALRIDPVTALRVE